MTKLKSLLFLILLAQGAAMAAEGGNPAIPTKPNLFLALRNGVDANQVSRLLKKGADANQLGPEGRRRVVLEEGHLTLHIQPGRATRHLLYVERLL